MTRSIYKHYFSNQGRCLDGFKKITFFFGKTSQTGPKSPRKLPLLTQISPSVVSNLTKTLGWVGKQIWENFPKKMAFILGGSPNGEQFNEQSQKQDLTNSNIEVSLGNIGQGQDIGICFTELLKCKLLTGKDDCLQITNSSQRALLQPIV